MFDKTKLADIFGLVQLAIVATDDPELKEAVMHINTVRAHMEHDPMLIAAGIHHKAWVEATLKFMNDELKYREERKKIKQKVEFKFTHHNNPSNN